MKQNIVKEIEIPQGVSAELDGSILHVKGPKGNVDRNFMHSGIMIEKQDSRVILGADKSTKREKKMLGTVAAHIGNMFKGVLEGFEYKLQVCSVHFPITVHVDAANHALIIKNFLGEVRDRKAKILDGVDVRVAGGIITVNSVDKERAGQTALNLENASRVKGKDKRVFQDGIFMLEKAGKKI